MPETRDTCPEEVTVETNFTRREEIPMRTRKECQRRVRAKEAGKEFEEQMVKGCQEGFLRRGIT